MTDKEFSWPAVSRPDAFAHRSPRVQKADRFVWECIQKIQDKALAALIRSILTPLHETDCTWLLTKNAAARKNAPELCARLTTPLEYDAWWGAPAAAAHSHHCYPGGWLLHNATNLHALRMLMQTAQEIRNVSINPDALLAGMLLHDCLKPRLFLWENGELTADQGECGHHVAALAEGYLRGVPVDALRMLAGVHVGWWQNVEGVARYLQQAAELIDQPELAGAAAPRMDFLPETWIMRQGEAAWYGATKTAIQEVNTRLREAVELLVPEAHRTAATWWVLMQYDELELLRKVAAGTLGDTVRKVLSAVIPACC
jgi:hypothetical protein